MFSTQERPAPIVSLPGRIPTVVQAGIFAACIIALFLPFPSAGSVSPGTEGAVTEWGPWITNTTPWSATIHWKTGNPGIGSIDYSPLDNGTLFCPWISVSERNPEMLHQVTLQGLTPGTTYAYHLAGDSGFFQFRTPPLAGPVKFIVYGDTRGQEGWKNQALLKKSVADAIAREQDILFVLHTGDLVYDPGNASDWQDFFDTSGVFLANVSFFPVAGNHEDNLTEYLAIFGMPACYSFSCGDAKVIVLNSNPMSAGDEQVQQEWLEAVLASSPGWTFVALHHPLYSSEASHYGGRPDLQASLGDPFMRSGVSAVFSAHVHAYEHYEHGGVHYFTVGTGGAPFYPLSTEKPDGFVNSLENTVGYAVVAVDEKTVAIAFVRVAEEKNGVVTIFPPDSVAETVIIRKSPFIALLQLTLPFGEEKPGEIELMFPSGRHDARFL